MYPEHIEIFPIELKLDYKPKRVDFAALREGKTIELMNFFHFDAAEMTLRHVTISGVGQVTEEVLWVLADLADYSCPAGTDYLPHCRISGHRTSRPTNWRM